MKTDDEILDEYISNLDYGHCEGSSPEYFRLLIKHSQAFRSCLFSIRCSELFALIADELGYNWLVRKLNELWK